MIRKKFIGQNGLKLVEIDWNRVEWPGVAWDSLETARNGRKWPSSRGGRIWPSGGSAQIVLLQTGAASTSAD